MFIELRITRLSDVASEVPALVPFGYRFASARHYLPQPGFLWNRNVTEDTDSCSLENQTAKQKRRPVASVVSEAAGVFRQTQRSGSMRYIFGSARKRLRDIICNLDAQASRKVISQLQTTVWFLA
jgi:hypothetical protein